MAMFPIRCVVEAVADGQCIKCADGGSVLVDSYAIVSGYTQLSQLVETVLTALGLQHLCYGAQGTIQVKNWKPLTFEEVTNDPDIEVENLLKDISNHLTLRILAKQSDSAIGDCVRDMKDRLLQTVWHKIPQVANDIQQPQLKELVTNLVQGEGPRAIDAQLMYMFNVWLEQMNKAGGKNGMGPLWGNSNGRASSGGGISGGQAAGSRFSASLEIPKLERWFRDNQNPTRQKLLQYMTLMNNSSYRKHTTKITYQQICNWFMNARASLRKRGGQHLAAAGGGGRRSGADSLSKSEMVDSDPAETWPGSKAASAGKTPACPDAGVSFNAGGKLSSTLLDNASGAEDAQPSSPTANGQRSPSASSRASGDNGREDGSGLDDSAALDQEHCPPLYFNSISMATRPESGEPGELSVSPLLENGGGSSSRADTPSSTPYGTPGSASATGVNANRTRLMFDPLTELPMLERWFEENPHPSWVQVDQFTEMLNVMPYRQTYPPVSAHNVKIWFKNRRAKFKRNLVGASVKAEPMEQQAAVN